MSYSVREYRTSTSEDDIAESIADEAEALAMAGGRLAVVTNRPEQLAAVTERQWRARIQRLEAQQRTTRNHVVLARITTRVSLMESVIFSTWIELADVPADVCFGTAANFAIITPECEVMCVEAPLDEEAIDHLTRKMPRCSRIVVFTVRARPEHRQ